MVLYPRFTHSMATNLPMYPVEPATATVVSFGALPVTVIDNDCCDLRLPKKVTKGGEGGGGGDGDRDGEKGAGGVSMFWKCPAGGFAYYTCMVGGVHVLFSALSLAVIGSNRDIRLEISCEGRGLRGMGGGGGESLKG